MCMQEVGTAALGVVGAAADVATGGALTPALVAGALSVAGAVTEGIAQQEAVNKQNDIAAAGIIKQGQLQQQGENDVGQVTKQISSQTPAQQTAAQLASYQKALNEQSAVMQSDQPSVPGASKAYTQEKAISGGDASNYVQALAKSGAVTEGTQLERVQEGQEIAGTASNLGLLQTQSNEQAYLTKLQIQATQANPWLMAMGKVMQGAGTAVSMGAGAGMFGSPAAAVDPTAGTGVVNVGTDANPIGESFLPPAGGIPNSYAGAFSGAPATGPSGNLVSQYVP